MYYPKQIPYLLDKDFKTYIKYTEYKVKELEDYCMCIWTMKSKKVLNKTITNNILPDACIDIVIDYTNKTICFAGFSSETYLFELKNQIDYMGVRLKPGSFYFLFNIAADKIMDNEISFTEIEKEYELFDILKLETQDQRISYLTNYLLKKINTRRKMPFVDFVEQLYKNPKDQTVTQLAQKFGYNKRHLYRIFKTNYGVSPKVLLNILRLHLCLTLILDKNVTLTEIANTCGFYDQAHFIKTIKKYTGISPIKILKSYG